MTLKQQLQSLKPYVAGKPLSDQEYIKLNANECPFKLPSSVYKIASRLRGIHRYHEGSGYELRQKIAQGMGFTPEQLILGNGSGELILLFLMAFIESSKKVVISEGTFSLYSMYALMNGNETVRIPLDSELRMDLEAMARAVDGQTGAVFICNPNNPTGHSWPYENIEGFLKSVPQTVAVFLDEAYIHYSPYDNAEKIKILIENFKNLFVLRTFSKLGLAGVRCGYGMAQEEVMEQLHRIRPPFNVNAYALAQASALLEEKKYLSYIRNENFRQLEFLSKGLAAAGLKVYPSHANFVLVKGPENLDRVLESKKVLIRKAQSFGLSADDYRITVGTRKENEILLKRLKEDSCG